jgi:hypothetical protein
MSAASTAAIAFNMMSQENNRRDREAAHDRLREAEEKHHADELKRRTEIFRKVSRRQPPKHRPRTEDDIDNEIISSLPAKNGVIRLI